MKKGFLFAALILVGTAVAMVRTQVEVGPQGTYYDGYYYQDGEYADYWYGPGWYWGAYYDDAPAYFAWRRRYWGGPYYWRYNRPYRYHNGYHRH